MAALEPQADTRPGRTSALADTGRSGSLKRPDLSGSYRPGVVIRIEFHPTAALWIMVEVRNSGQKPFNADLTKRAYRRFNGPGRRRNLHLIAHLTALEMRPSFDPRKKNPACGAEHFRPYFLGVAVLWCGRPTIFRSVGRPF